VNGVLAPFLLVCIYFIASDHRIMLGQPSSPITRAVVAATTLLMFGACVGMFVF